jgi:hypothetical protein
MKKIAYIILIAIASAITFTSCTEEEVMPTSGKNGGAGVSDPL